MSYGNQRKSLWFTIRKPILTILLAPCLITSVVVNSPPSPYNESFVRFVKPVLGFAGLCYAFRPFTPNPREFDETYGAVVTFQDGKTRTWAFPSLTLSNPSSSDGWLKRMQTMWHLHIWDCLAYRMSKDEILWKDAARYVASRHSCLHNQPISVSLFKEHRAIVLPYSSLPVIKTREAQRTSFFEYQVKPEDLK